MASSTPKRTLRLSRTIVLVGMMGAGKTSIGRRLGQELATPFFDSDHEIEEAAGMTVAEIFSVHGEAAFRDAERKVIQRLLAGEAFFIATGGGAFADERTRKAISEGATSIWLRASIPVLAERVSRNKRRPLLEGKDPTAVLTELAEKRNPFYREADIIIDTDGMTAEQLISHLIETLTRQGLIVNHEP